MRLWILVVFVFAGLVISCGGSSSEPDVSSTATPTAPTESVATQSPDASTSSTSDTTPSSTSVPESSEVAEPDLRYTSESIFNGLSSAAVDPIGFDFVELGEFDNSTAARSFEDPDLWLERFTGWGREMGYVETYESSANFDIFQYWAEVYEDSSGAEKSFDEQIDDFPKRMGRTYKATGVQVTSSGEVKGDSVGEDTFRYRFRVADSDTGESGDVVLVTVRDGNLIASVFWGSETNILVGELVDFAQGLLDAFRTALLVSSQPPPELPTFAPDSAASQLSDDSPNNPELLDHQFLTNEEDLDSVGLSDTDPLTQALDKYLGMPPLELLMEASEVDFRQVRRQPENYRGTLLSSVVTVTDVVDYGDGRILAQVCQSDLDIPIICQDYDSQAIVVFDTSTFGRVFTDDIFFIVGIVESVQENEIFELSSADDLIVVSLLLNEFLPDGP